MSGGGMEGRRFESYHPGQEYYQFSTVDRRQKTRGLQCFVLFLQGRLCALLPSLSRESNSKATSACGSELTRKPGQAN